MQIPDVLTGKSQGVLPVKPPPPGVRVKPKAPPPALQPSEAQAPGLSSGGASSSSCKAPPSGFVLIGGNSSLPGRRLDELGQDSTSYTDGPPSKTNIMSIMARGLRELPVKLSPPSKPVPALASSPPCRREAEKPRKDPHLSAQKPGLRETPVKFAPAAKPAPDCVSIGPRTESTRLKAVNFMTGASHQALSIMTKAQPSVASNAVQKSYVGAPPFHFGMVCGKNAVEGKNAVDMNNSHIACPQLFSEKACLEERCQASPSARQPSRPYDFVTPSNLGLDPTAPEWFPPGQTKPSAATKPAPGLELPAESVSSEAAPKHPELDARQVFLRDDISSATHELDLQEEYPLHILKAEILRQRQEIANLRNALGEAQALFQRCGFFDSERQSWDL